MSASVSQIRITVDGDALREKTTKLEAMFRNVAVDASDIGLQRVDFCWRDGPSSRLPVERLLQLQRESLGPNLLCSNELEVDLDGVTSRHLRLLADGVFDTASVALDVYREGADAGRLGRRLERLQPLLKRRLAFTAEAPLDLRTVAYAAHSFRFFDGLRIVSRFRPGDDLDGGRLAQAWLEVFEAWLASENATETHPIGDFVGYAISHSRGKTQPRDTPRRATPWLIVKAGGDVCEASDEGAAALGNLLHSGLAQILRGEASRSASQAVSERVIRHCGPCPYFGACPGSFVAGADRVWHARLDESGCPVRPTLDLMVATLAGPELHAAVVAPSADEPVQAFRAADAAGDGSTPAPRATSSWPELFAGGATAVTLFVAPGCEPTADRLELSNGSRPVTAEEIDRFGYEAGARVPREPWRPPSAAENAALATSGRPTDWSRALCVVSLGEPEVTLPELLREADGRPSRRAMRLLRRVCELGEPLSSSGVTRNPADLRTLTIDGGSRRRIGLHVDNWDDLGLVDKHRATNRLSVNVGAGHRYFLYLPMGLGDMAELLVRELGPAGVPAGRYSVIGRRFMALFPHLPVVRCRLAPGEAYVAPTENLVHDGSSEGQTASDEHYTVRGHIRLRRRGDPWAGLRRWGLGALAE
jgi:hypothetical protein